MPVLLSEKERQKAAELLPDFIKEILKESNVNALDIVTEFSGLPQFDKIIEKCRLSPYQYDKLFKWFVQKNEEIFKSEERILNELKKDIIDHKFYMIHLLNHMERLVDARKSMNKSFKSCYKKDLQALEL